MYEDKIENTSDQIKQKESLKNSIQPVIKIHEFFSAEMNPKLSTQNIDRDAALLNQVENSIRNKHQDFIIDEKTNSSELLKDGFLIDEDPDNKN